MIEEKGYYEIIRDVFIEKKVVCVVISTDNKAYAIRENTDISRMKNLDFSFKVLSDVEEAFRAESSQKKHSNLLIELNKWLADSLVDEVKVKNFITTQDIASLANRLSMVAER